MVTSSTIRHVYLIERRRSYQCDANYPAGSAETIEFEKDEVLESLVESETNLS